MPRKKTESVKTVQKIEISVTEILIAENDALKPYIQTFHYDPENIAFQTLGSVFGIFEIDAQSEDSAYIVNFLASIVKKEYYTHPKRSSIESLEATLHKINTALSKLIKQDNTAWLGKLNAAICVFDKNQIHFTVSGKAKTLLIRDSSLTDISEGLTEESELHPLKTFTEVSSGKLKESDKIILTTPGLFEVITPQDLQKNADRFTQEQFSQYIKTALVNQLLFGGTLIVNVNTKIIKKSPVTKTKTVSQADTEIPNAFSQLAFSKKSDTELIQEANEITETEPDTEYTDSKTGHIYIQGDIPEIKSNEKWVHFAWKIEDISNIFFATFKKFTIRSFRQVQCYIKTRYISINHKQNQPVHVDVKTDTTSESNAYQMQSDFSDTTSDSTYENDNYDTLNDTFHENSYTDEAMKSSAVSPFKTKETLDTDKQEPPVWNQKIKEILHQCTPKVHSLHNLFTNFNNKQKLMVLGALFAIFIIPYLIISAQGKNKVTDTKNTEVLPMVVKNPIDDDRKMHSIADTKTLASNNTLLKMILLKNAPFAITKTSVLNLENPSQAEEFPLPSQYGNAILQATNMNDIGTIFLLTDTGKMISFSPYNKRFSENEISLPDTSHIIDMSAYLTYIYILDSKSNAILRYPRTSGGFSESTQWLKESLEIKDTDTLTLSEDLYIAKGDQLIAYNRGKRDQLSFEKSETPIVFSYIYTSSDIQHLYTLDAVNGRVVQFNKSGVIVSQFSNDSFKNARSLVVDEQTQTAFTISDSRAISFKLN